MEYFYGAEIVYKEILADGLIKIIVNLNGANVEYHLTQEEIDNSQVA